IMMGCHFMAAHPRGSVPFRQVYIHALVRDAERQKMSKTKGNTLDPIEIIEKYGTDAVRFTLASMAAPGTDIAFNEARTEGYRAFANKIWNAARFLFLHADRAEESGVWSLSEFQQAARHGTAQPAPQTLEDRWITSRFHRVAAEVHAALESYRFHEAAHQVYGFFWGEFCDWYIEMVKLRLSGGESEAERQSARQALQRIFSLFEAALRMLSPFMPFVTEELWHALYDGQPPQPSIALTQFPQSAPAQVDLEAEAEMAVLQDLIVTVRAIRADLKVESRAATPIEVFAAPEVRRLLEENRVHVEKLASVEAITFVDSSLAKAAGARTTARFEVRVLYQRKVDVAAERGRLQKDLARMEGEYSNAQCQLANRKFLEKAPPQVVEGIRRRSGELEALLEKTRSALDELSG
ncbi:MAG: class I tRNA ligase family protein, partial [Terriglobales bacterium]